MFDATTKSFTYNFPVGGILTVNDYDWRSNNARGQLNYDQSFFKHSAVMEAAKISSTATYHKLIRELSEYGYICYQPSYNKRKASTIYL